MTNAPARRRLLFAKGYLDLILAGRKQITIRAGRRKFAAGERVDGVCAEGRALPLRIVGCESKALMGITEEEAKADLFESKEEVLAGMQRYYPELTWQSEVTLIRFEMIRDEAS